MYCYGPAGDVAHWRQELDGTLPRAGVEAPPLPAGAPAAMHREAARINMAMNHPFRRHHHERRHRTHGAEPASAPLHPRHHAAGRRAARRRETIMPRPLLVGRNAGETGSHLAASAAGCAWTTDLDAALADPTTPIYFDAQTTDRRAEAVRQAIAAGKHIYCEKPIAGDVGRRAGSLSQSAKQAGVKHGVVQDKLWLPGLLKLKTLHRPGLLRPHPFGARRVRLLGVRRRHGAGRSGLRGTTARKTAAASSSTCSATGATCSTICSAP